MASDCINAGQWLRQSLPSCPRVRYGSVMLLLAIALAASEASPAPVNQVSATARATIRILSAVQLRVGAETSEDGRPVREASIRGEDGKPQPAKLVEFE